ncbi:MAG: glycogen-binding domain-containing protein [Victivallales bacterium]|jgi:1,4-alpha-glucan branching enzyme
MKKRKQSTAKEPQAPVKQDNGKFNTFMWPLGNVKEVCLAGDFNDWKPEPMRKDVDGFRATVKLKAGLYQYKFVVDGEWQVDPFAKGNALNEFGTVNSVVLIE